MSSNLPLTPVVGILCELVSDFELNQVVCNGTVFVELEPALTPSSTTFWMYLGLSIFLVLFAGLMSGLTLGLLSMDLTSLKVIISGGTPKDRKYARTILPLIEVQD
jgi:ankyrin repeat/SOCS box protein 13/metal transporter CNNM